MRSSDRGFEKVPNDKSLFYCSSCEKTFSCGSSSVRRHAESARHKYLSSRKIPRMTMHAKVSRKTFMPQWLEDFKPWMNKVTDDPFSCFCSVCKKSFACGLSQI